MAKLTRKQLDEEIKLRFLEGVKEHLENCGEEVLMVKSNEIALPVVDSEGEERWLVLTFKVPTGERGGDAYDGYSMAEDYQMKLVEKAEKAKAKEAEAAKKKAKAEKAKEKGGSGEKSATPQFKRFCTFCGGAVEYFTDEEGHAFGKCKCGNIDYCDNWPTIEEVKRHYAEREIK